MSWIPRYGRLVRRAPVSAPADEPTDALQQPAEDATPGAPENEPEQRPEPVPIPEDWRALPWNDLRALAAGFSAQDAPVRNKADAIARIEAELATRAAHASAVED
ncbi:hypothetical protein AA309_20200 [Microvirga vignae]|uniref:Uncharacterized protein n=1 Tax=Microvirga vignae TaxID=1225564 RepID=A0A0H1R8P6_9HYPH|nr:hypothetical protein [Microvirga vignae]KLK91419.1 hypothetical protein AA309_20200 [Microvirga vignae]